MSVHSFDTDVADMVGTTAATIAYNIQHWCEKNAANDLHFHDDRYWTYNTVTAFEELFPYLTKKQIRTALDKLEAAGILVSGNYNKHGRDQTKWYSFVPEAVVKATSCPKGQMQLPKRASPIAQKGKPLPDRKPDNKPSSIEDESGREDETKIAFDGYCTMARKRSWAVPRDMTRTRQAALKKRIKENKLEGWGDALRKASESDFLSGRTDKPFTLTLDWLLKPSNLLKVLEGNYDNRTSTVSPASQRSQRNGGGQGQPDAFERLAQRLAVPGTGQEPSRRQDYGAGEGVVIDATAA